MEMLGASDGEVPANGDSAKSALQALAMKIAPSTSPVARVRVALEHAGCDARGREHKFVAKCPAHDDRIPSCSVSEGADGRALVHCFAGCQTEAVVAALGLQMGDLFADPPSGPQRPPTLRNRFTVLAGRFDERVHEAVGRRRSQDGRTLTDALVQLVRDGREFSASLAFTCPWCERGHAWIRRDRNGLVADCDAGCAEHEVLEALAGLGQEAA